MQPDDIETTGQIDALRAFASSAELAQLRQQAAAAKSAPDELDFLDVLGVFWLENVHSNFLGWLLNPAASHGVGDYFLKKFLLATAERSSNLWNKIEKANWSGAAVQLEWHAIVNGGYGYLDILIVNPEPPILCAIENKVFSPEGGHQLTHYRKALENNYPNFTRHYVFLSPSGMSSQWEDERKYWTPANYTTVRQLVEQTLDDNADSISEDVRVFLRQYATTLRRKIVPVSNEVQQLARKIYLGNRAVLDFLYDNKPNYVAETQQILREAIVQQGNWEIDQSTTGYLRFRPSAWTQFEAFETGTAFAYTKALLLFEFYIAAGSANLRLTLLQGDDELIRERLIASVNQNPGVFNRSPISHQEASGPLDIRENILNDADLDNWDDPSTRAKIIAWVADFAENRFPKMNEVIINCLREYEAGQSLPQGQ